MPDAHAARRARARSALAAAVPGADALLVTSLPNVRYLSGFTGSNAVLLLPADPGPHGDGAVLGTDGRYTTQAGAQCPDLPLVVDRATAAAVVAEARRRGAARVAVEAEHLSLAAFHRLGGADGAPALAPTTGLVEALRATKDADELAALRRACAITDAAWTALLPALRPGRTEREVARALEALMLDLGAEAPAFDTIVAAGEDGAVPHHEPGGRPLRAGDLVTVDFGARADGYHADCTRTVALVRADGWQRDLHALVVAAQAAGTAAAVAGARAGDVDAAARGVVEAAGHGEHFVHGTGHGVGLEIHEAPMLTAGADGILGDRTPVTVEPGVYLPGRGGVRVEDTVLVSGAAPEPLTTTARDLLVVG